MSNDDEQGQYGDGFGGATAQKFPSHVETLPHVPTGLPPIPGQGSSRFPSAGAQDWDSDGDSGAEQGLKGGGDDGIPCPDGSCSFRSRSSHGMARHTHARHGGFGGLGKAYKP